MMAVSTVVITLTILADLFNRMIDPTERNTNVPQFSLYDEEFHPSPWQRTWASFRASHIAMFGLIMLALFVVCALFAPIITP